jgi:hypothetical protein
VVAIKMAVSVSLRPPIAISMVRIMDLAHREANLATLCRFSGQEHAGGPVANWQCGKLTFFLVAS